MKRPWWRVLCRRRRLSENTAVVCVPPPAAASPEQHLPEAFCRPSVMLSVTSEHLYKPSSWSFRSTLLARQAARSAGRARPSRRRTNSLCSHLERPGTGCLSQRPGPVMGPLGDPRRDYDSVLGSVKGYQCLKTLMVVQRSAK